MLDFQCTSKFLYHCNDYMLLVIDYHIIDSDVLDRELNKVQKSDKGGFDSHI